MCIRDRYWPKISPPVRLRPAPSTPVTQKTHPTAHPVCDDRQMVVCPSIGIATASTTAPSAKPRASFAVPSAPRRASRTSGSRTWASSASPSRSAFGRLDISATLPAMRRASHWYTCSARNGRGASPARSWASSARLAPTRLGRAGVWIGSVTGDSHGTQDLGVLLAPLWHGGAAVGADDPRPLRAGDQLDPRQRGEPEALHGGARRPQGLVGFEHALQRLDEREQ